MRPFRHFQVVMNRTWNRKICNQFDEMATKLGEIPDKTKDLVNMQKLKYFYQKCVTIFAAKKLFKSST